MDSHVFYVGSEDANYSISAAVRNIDFSIIVFYQFCLITFSKSESIKSCPVDRFGWWCRESGCIWRESSSVAISDPSCL